MAPGLVSDVTVDPRKSTPTSKDTIWLFTRVEAEAESGQFPGGVGEGAFGRASVGDRDGDVVGVADRPVAAGQHGPVEGVEVQVAEQRRQRAALVQAQAAFGPGGVLADHGPVHEPPDQVHGRPTCLNFPEPAHHSTARNVLQAAVYAAPHHPNKFLHASDIGGIVTLRC